MIYSMRTNFQQKSVRLRGENSAQETNENANV